MEINYPIVGFAILVLIIFIVWLIRRNRKDEKKFEQDMSQAEIKPEKHTDDSV